MIRIYLNLWSFIKILWKICRKYVGNYLNITQVVFIIFQDGVMVTLGKGKNMKKINFILGTLIAVFSINLSAEKLLNFNQANVISSETLKQVNASSTYKIIYKKEKNGEYKYTLEKLLNFDNDKNLKVFVNGTEDNLDSAVKKAINQNMTSSDKKKS